MIDIKRLRLTFDLPVILGNVLYLLLTEEIVSNEDLMALTTNPRVTMYRLRQVLSPIGISIEVRRDLGYWMSDEHKKAIIDIALPPKGDVGAEQLEEDDAPASA